MLSCRRSFFLTLSFLIVEILPLCAFEIPIELAPGSIIHVDTDSVQRNDEDQTVTILLDADEIEFLFKHPEFLARFERKIQEQWNLPVVNIICKNVDALQCSEISISTTPPGNEIIFKGYEIPNPSQINCDAGCQIMTFSYKKIKREDEDYANNIFMRSFILAESQASLLFSNSFQHLTQLSIGELMGQKSYLVVQIRNNGDNAVEGELQFRHPAELFPVPMSVKLPSNMQDIYCYLIPLGIYPMANEFTWPIGSINDCPDINLKWETLQVVSYQSEPECDDGEDR